MSKRQILVTSALPYANGPIHLGHLVEYIQTDIWVRFQKLRGHECRYFCADDTHGTATMIRARQEGREPEALIAEMSEDHQRDFRDFGIRFDHYGSTNSPSNEKLVAEVWAALRAADLVAERDVTQLFDPEAGVFLADRFVTGTCPRCGAADQYGDSCDKCGATYSPSDLKNPRSTLSGAVPEERTAPHLFVVLKEGQTELQPGATLEQAQEAAAVTINYGAFTNNILAFVLVTIVMFMFIRLLNKLDQELDERLGKDELAPEQPTEKKCPFCRTIIAHQATRCPFCTSQLEDAAAD